MRVCFLDTDCFASLATTGGVASCATRRLAIRDRVRSVALDPCELIGMEISVSEQLLAHPGALHEEPDVELVGHPHPAVHLHAFLNGKRRGRTRPRLCDRDRGGGVFEVAVQRLKRFQYRSPGDLDLDVDLRGAMLQCLEFTDQFAELLALLQVVDGTPEHLLAHAHQFGSHRSTADVEHAFQQMEALIDLTEYAVGVNLDMVE